MSITGQGRFDVSLEKAFTYPLRHAGARSVIVEFAQDGNGNGAGSVAVFLGQAVGGVAWFTLANGKIRHGPIPQTDFLTIVPSSNAVGVCTVTLSEDNLGVGIHLL
jgi:hypothetical protein